MLLSQRLTVIAKLAFSAGMTPEWFAYCSSGSGLPRDVRHWLEAPDIRANNEQRRNSKYTMIYSSNRMFIRNLWEAHRRGGYQPPAEKHPRKRLKIQSMRLAWGGRLIAAPTSCGAMVPYFYHDF